MVYANEFDTEAVTQLYAFVRVGVKLVELRLVATRCFFHRLLEHAGGEFTGVDRGWDAVHKVLERTNVVKVSVRKDQATNLVLALFEVCWVWHDIVDAWVVATREQEAHVDDDNVIVVLDSHHVLTNGHFTQTTDWDHTQNWALGRLEALLLDQSELLTFVAVIDRLVDWHINDVLASDLRYKLAVAAGCALHFTATGLSASQDAVLLSLLLAAGLLTVLVVVALAVASTIILLAAVVAAILWLGLIAPIIFTHNELLIPFL